MSFLERDWRAAPGASDEAIQQLIQTVPIQLPKAYLALLRISNGGEGPLPRQPLWLQLDAAETVSATSVSGRHDEFFPDFLIIGSNGGGEFIAFDLRKSGEPSLIYVDMIAGPETAQHLASDFDEFVGLIGRE